MALVLSDSFTRSKDWAIPNFTFRVLDGKKSFLSERFRVGDGKPTNLQLIVYPKGVEGNSKFMSIYLKSHYERTIVTAKYTISILKYGVPHFSKSHIDQIAPGAKSGFAKFISMKDLLKDKTTLLTNDTLKIKINLEASLKPVPKDTTCDTNDRRASTGNMGLKVQEQIVETEQVINRTKVITRQATMSMPHTSMPLTSMPTNYFNRPSIGSDRASSGSGRASIGSRSDLLQLQY